MGKDRKMERTAFIARVERGAFFFFVDGWARVMGTRGVRGGDGGGILPSGNGDIDIGVPGVRGVAGWSDMGEEGGWYIMYVRVCVCACVIRETRGVEREIAR